MEPSQTSSTDKFFATPSYFLNPRHPISVELIGCGGTGSHVLMGLAAIHNACIANGHPGFFVQVWDPDKVESHNVGRQYFSTADIGLNKGAALVTRVNRMYGTRWVNFPFKFQQKHHSNIYISCVDSIQARRQIHLMLQPEVLSDGKKQTSFADHEKQYLWFDSGNNKDSGQIIIGSLQHAKFKLPHFFERFPDVKDTEEHAPSCSMRESLMRQDLHINKVMALYLNDMLWRMLRTGKIEIAGMYINHRLYQTSGIPV